MRSWIRRWRNKIKRELQEEVKEVGEGIVEEAGVGMLPEEAQEVRNGLI